MFIYVSKVWVGGGGRIPFFGKAKRALKIWRASSFMSFFK